MVNFSRKSYLVHDNFHKSERQSIKWEHTKYIKSRELCPYKPVSPIALWHSVSALQVFHLFFHLILEIIMVDLWTLMHYKPCKPYQETYIRVSANNTLKQISGHPRWQYILERNQDPLIHMQQQNDNSVFFMHFVSNRKLGMYFSH